MIFLSEICIVTDITQRKLPDSDEECGWTSKKIESDGGAVETHADDIVVMVYSRDDVIPETTEVEQERKT